MNMSQNGKELLAQWEGIRNNVYKDVAGLETIGVGHLLTKEELRTGQIVIKGQSFDYRKGLDNGEVMDLLSQDLVRFEEAIQDEVHVRLSQNQFDALVSFVFNVGIGAFKESTLLKILNRGSYDAIPDQLRRWVKAGGKTVQGMVNRRENEIKLWNS